MLQLQDSETSLFSSKFLKTEDLQCPGNFKGLSLVIVAETADFLTADTNSMRACVFTYTHILV